jgi:tetratricopeptide (TPR) repeat protein
MDNFFVFTGRHEGAVRYGEQALRLDPIPPFWYYQVLAGAYVNAGRYQEAIAACKKVLHRAPNDVLTHIILTNTYSQAGRVEEARAAAAEVLRIDPNFSAEERGKLMPFKNPEDRERILEGLRKAGLK